MSSDPTHGQHERAKASRTRERSTGVIGTAVGYGVQQIAPFVRSLRSAGYAGQIVMIVHARDLAALTASPSLRGVRWHPVNTLRLNLRFNRGRYEKLWLPLQALELMSVRLAGRLPGTDETRRRLQRALASRLFHPELSRFIYYLQLLQADPSLDYVLLTDVRDVVFQTDPFDALGDETLAFGLESSAYTNDTEYWNRRWLRASYGEEMIERLVGCPVSCAGVAYGTRSRLLSYLELMIGEILRYTLAGFAQMADQANHNALVWTGRLDSPTLMQPLASPVATLNFFSLDQLTLDDQGRLLNEDGSVVSILHQHDRVPGLTARLASGQAAAPDARSVPVS